MAITPEMCVGGRDLSEPRLRSDGSVIVYAAAEEGVAALLVHSVAGEHSDRMLATDPALRPARGLGGGSWCFTADESAVVYVAVDGDLWLQSLSGGESRRLTAIGSERSVSSPCCASRSIVYTVDQAEVHRLLLDNGTTSRLDDGSADFCFDPCIGPEVDSTRWQAWNVPDMPWDHSRIQLHVDKHAGSAITDLPASGSVQQPRVLPDGRSICVRDDNGWLNIWVDGRCAVAEPFEHAGPTWGSGQRSYAWSPDGKRVAFTRNDRGFGSLCVTDIDGDSPPFEVAWGMHGQLSWAGGRLAAVCSGPLDPPAVVVYDTTSWQRMTVAVGGTANWAEADLVAPAAVEIATDTGSIHARLYSAPAPSRALIVWLHGGPTDQWQVSFMPRLAYWVAQGWNVLVPDHRGSTGLGRAYQQALRGQWGKLDVADTLAATEHAHGMRWGTPDRTVVMGGSAGGFTALEAVATRPSLFAATVVLYPVTDLIDLAERSYRFERHYTDSLIGPLPAAVAEYRKRSPILHADRFVSTPILVLHGDADPIVPVEQSRAFADNVRAAGGDIELHVYEGEGHGFRQRANQLDEYRRIAGFLARHVPLAFAQ